MKQELLQRISSKRATIAVVGAGYVGLALAMAFAKGGFRVIALDTSGERVRSLNEGRSYLNDIPSSELAEHVSAGRLCATSDYAATREADVIFVCVPTPFNRAKAPDLSFIESAARGIASNLRPGQLVILESTTYPGTTEEVMQPILETSGLRAGYDFWLAFSPERIDPGNTEHTIENTPKVVGGIDATSTELATLALRQVVARSNVHPVSSTRVAELTKLLENTFRSVNIALVNELTQLCDRMGIDVWEVIGAAKTKPYGFMPFYPGPGVGGHCIPVDPYYLAWKAREYDFSTKFIELAAETNQYMPFFTVDKLRRTLQADGVAIGGAKVLVLGAAFKRDVDDARNSAAVRTIEVLSAEGADVTYHDPFIPSVRLSTGLYNADAALELKSVALDAAAIRAVDCVLILVAHSRIDYEMVATHAKRVFDAVNAMATLGGQTARVVRL